LMIARSQRTTSGAMCCLRIVRRKHFCGSGTMKKPKPKPNEPSLRDKLSANFLRAFESDFETNGVDVIKQLREKSPEKYADIASRLIAASEPKPDGYEQCQSLREIGIKLLKNVGCNEFDITEAMVADAMAANEAFIERLEQIKAEAMQ